MNTIAQTNAQPVANEVSLEDARIYIEQLDLSYIINAMCSPAYPLPRWTLSDAGHCAKLYKNFLYLSKKHASVSLVPSKEIDEFWHNHILYTRQYIEDCLQIFGYYYHHQPASPDENPERLAKDYLKTKQLYLAEFKESLQINENHQDENNHAKTV